MALEVRIKKYCNNFTLDINFVFKNGILGVLGASGCGKSMTLKCIAGIVTPDEGRIVLDGKVLFDSAAKINLPPQQRNVGYLFQNYALFPHMTVEQNIAAGIKISDKVERQALIDKYVKIFYLEGLLKAYPRNLSGGQQQRVALARIFASEPSILMLDEPFSALDDFLKWQVELELAKILKLYAHSILFVSHNRDEIYRFCDEVAVLSKGSIVSFSSKKKLFDAPETLAASKLSGCKNHSQIEITDEKTVFAVDWGMKLHIACDSAEAKNCSYIGIRAHEIAIISEQSDLVKATDRNVFEVNIEAVVENIFSTIIMVRYPGAKAPLRIEVEKEQWQTDRCVGEKIWIQLPDKYLFLLHD